MNKTIKYLLLAGAFILISEFSFGQNIYTLKLHYDKKSKDIAKLKVIKEFNDSISLQKEVSSLHTQLQSIGYIEASIDSANWTNKTSNTYITIGQQYKWSNIEKGEVDWTNLPNLNYRFRDFNLRKFNYQELIELEEAIIVSLENSGYPFAVVSLGNIKIKQKKISARLEIDRGDFIKIDTIILDKYNEINLSFLQQSIGIFISQEYNESKVKKIDQQLNRLNFIKVSKSSEVEFIDNKASIIIHLQKQSSNQFDGIIGFQPAANASEKMLVTGQLNLKLENILKHGESIHLKWESPGNQSQNLLLSMQYPYLAGSPFGLALDFKLNKRDTSFLNIIAKPAMIFAWNPNNSISTYGNFFSSKSLSTNINDSYQKGVIDINYNAFGISLNFNHLDYPFNPLKGYKISFQVDAGKKTISNYSDLSVGQKDSTNQHEYKYTGEMKLKLYIPFGERSTFLISNQSAIIDSKQLYNNELYRIGGTARMRGFDEQSVFASMYSISSLEYHFLLNKNSFMGPFYDFSYVENKINTSLNGFYQSFGVSFSFATQAGIFKLAYAVGKYPNQSFVFKQAKIHFGYTAVF